MKHDSGRSPPEASEKSSEEAKRILAKFPDRLPIICTKAARSDLPELDKQKFLVPPTMLCGEFQYILHKQVSQVAGASLAADRTIYLFVKDKTSMKTSTRMSDVYEQYKAADGFLYISYSAENSLG